MTKKETTRFTGTIVSHHEDFKFWRVKGSDGQVARLYRDLLINAVFIPQDLNVGVEIVGKVVETPRGLKYDFVYSINGRVSKRLTQNGGSDASGNKKESKPKPKFREHTLNACSMGMITRLCDDGAYGFIRPKCPKPGHFFRDIFFRTRDVSLSDDELRLLEVGNIVDFKVVEGLEDRPLKAEISNVRLSRKRKGEIRKTKENAEHEAQQAEKKKQAKLQRKQERLAKVMARTAMTVFTDTGARITGIPVTEDEWMTLGNGTVAVLVKVFDAETGPVDPIEAFTVRKNGGKPKQDRRVTVTWEPSVGQTGGVAGQQTGVNTPESVGTMSLVVDDRRQVVLVFETMDDLRAVRNDDLKDGEFVTSKDQRRERDGAMTVYQICDRKLDPKGLCFTSEQQAA